MSSQGLRDREFAEDEACFRQLERRFRESGRSDVEVLDFGMPGYNVEQHVLALEHPVLPFQPALVVVGLISNDLEPKTPPPRTVLLRPIEVSTLFRAGYFAARFVHHVAGAAPGPRADAPGDGGS